MSMSYPCTGTGSPCELDPHADTIDVESLRQTWIDLSETKSINASIWCVTYIAIKKLLKLTDENSCSDDKFAISELDGSTTTLVLTFSVNIHFRTLHALVFHTNKDIELNSSYAVAIDERT